MGKDEILDAIRRTAIDNGGTPLGRDRFHAETGIRASDWEGKYWVRWSEAVAEAGYEPNEFGRAFTNDHLLDNLALLVRDLGHFPIQVEMTMARTRNESFPAERAFRRFGYKQGRIRALAEYCSERPELDDVAAICAALVESDTEGDESNGEASATAEGYVYLVKSGKHYKIGRSNSAGRRFYEIELQLPEKLTVVHHVATDDPVGIERYWHTRFADKRANGEWFALTSADVKAFKRRRQFM